MPALRTAFEIELGGLAFYERAQHETADAELRELLALFAEMERGHQRTLSQRYHVEPGTPSTPGVERAAIFAGVERRVRTADDLFRIALAFEERAAELFREKSLQMPRGSPEGLLYEELAAEEREHVVLLTAERRRFDEHKRGVL